MQWDCQEYTEPPHRKGKNSGIKFSYFVFRIVQILKINPLHYFIKIYIKRNNIEYFWFLVFVCGNLFLFFFKGKSDQDLCGHSGFTLTDHWTLWTDNALSSGDISYISYPWNGLQFIGNYYLVLCHFNVVLSGNACF